MFTFDKDLTDTKSYFERMKDYEKLGYVIVAAGLLWLFTVFPYTLVKSSAVDQITNFNYEKPVAHRPQNVLSSEDKKNLCLKSKNCRLLAEAGYYEARGESLLGVWSVMHVILNRVEDSRWPNTINGVLSYRCHFSYRCDGSMKKGYQDKKSLDNMLVAAYHVLNGEIDSPVGDADHYYAPSKVKPFWAKHYEYVMTVGNHKFLKWE